MAQNVNPTFVKTPNRGLSKISTATLQSSAVTVYTGGSNGSKISGLIATAVNTTAAFDVTWGINNVSQGLFYLGTVSVPSNAGSSDSVPAVNLMNATTTPGLTIDSDGNPFLFLASSADTLSAFSQATSSAWAANAAIFLIATAGDF